MDRILVAIGGGSLKEKTTLPIDREIAKLALRGSDKRGLALFIPTASYDSLPYFNTFRKTYTSECNMKSDVVLLTKKDVPIEKNIAKIEAADLIYVGGGNTLHLIDVWSRLGILPHLRAAYERGCVIAGLSAGAICWFRDMYTDSDPNPEPYSRPETESYSLAKGFNWIQGAITPHFNLRPEFVPIAREAGFDPCYAVEDNAAIVFRNERLAGALSAGGNAYAFTPTDDLKPL